jgi:cephalosporin hydroxylase
MKRLMDVKPIGTPIIKLASFKLEVDEGNSATIEDYMKLAFSWLFLKLLTIKPIQIKEEIIQLLVLVAELRPKVLLEIGTSMGGTLYIFSKVAPTNATIISVDLLGEPFGRDYPKWKTRFYKSFTCSRQRIHLIRSDSHEPNTIEKVEKILVGRKLDFLFIDGDHTYEGVKKDFEMYSPLVRNGGIIAFHDIVEHPPETGCEVSRFWNEIKQCYKHLDIIKNRNQNWAGIGVIFL